MNVAHTAKAEETMNFFVKTHWYFVGFTIL